MFCNVGVIFPLGVRSDGAGLCRNVGCGHETDHSVYSKIARGICHLDGTVSARLSVVQFVYQLPLP